MAPTIVGALIKGAVEIFTNKEAFKENLKTKTTAAAGVAAAIGGGLDVTTPDNELSAIMYIAAGVLFLIRKYKG